jgi:enoyl-CoA hydratase/carnithine racemase
VVVAHPGARFGLTEVRTGYWPVFVFRAVDHAIGERRAMELSLTGREISAQEALDFGLVTEISSDALKRAMDIATRISAYSPSAIQLGLRYAHKIRGRSWRHAGEVGREVRSDLLATPDYGEGVRAAIEKRSPVWPSLRE